MGWSTHRTSEAMNQSKSFPLWWFGWECHTHPQASGFDQLIPSWGSCLEGSDSAALLVKGDPWVGGLWDHIASPYFQCPVSLLWACVWTGELAVFCSRCHICHLRLCLPASYPPGPISPNKLSLLWTASCHGVLSPQQRNWFQQILCYSDGQVPY